MKSHSLFIFLSILALNLAAQDLLEAQTFNVDCSRDTVLKCKYGAEISISKEAFSDSSGLPIKEAVVQITVKEAYDKDEMLLGGLSTQSSEGILVSNGMVYVGGHFQGKKIEISGSVKVKISATEGTADMKLYELGEDGSNWKKSKTELKLDTCASYRSRIIWLQKPSSKEEYEKWKIETYPKLSPHEQFQTDLNELPDMFGGGLITIKWLWKRRKRKPKEYYISVPIDTIWECQDGFTSTYSFNIMSFGWRNIDKLKKVKNPIRITVSTEATNVDLDVFLIFENKKICIRGYEKNNYYYFSRMPKNKEVIIIGYKEDTYGFVDVSIYKMRTTTLELIKLPKANKVTEGTFKRMLRELR